MLTEMIEIPTSHIEYPLTTGFVDHWLVAGPQASVVTTLEQFAGSDFKYQIARHYYQEDSGILQPPAEQSSFEVSADGSDAQKLTWQVIHCQDDHFVDLTAFYHTCHYLRSWAYAQVLSPAKQQATFVLTTNGPADVWLNGQHLHRHEHFHHQIPHSVRFPGRLCEGTNEILVRFGAVAVRECPYTMALEIVDAQFDELAIFLPTTLEPVARRQKLEEVMANAYLEQDVYYREDELRVCWPANMALSDKLTVRLQTRESSGRGRIYAEGHPIVRKSSVVNLGKVYQVPEGAYEIVLMPDLEEYYIHGMHVQRKLPLRIANSKYSQTPYGAYEQRRREALEDAARRNNNVFAEIAKIELGLWNQVNQGVILQTVDSINRRADCSDFYMVGLLGLMLRNMENPAFPEELEWPLTECVLNFKYWMDEPGDDAMCYWSENHQLLFHTCEILAGQLFPNNFFTNVNRQGGWHKEKGERMALSWLRKRGSGGFREWDSNTYFEEDVLALAHLADLAENVEVAEMAAIVLDKMFFSMAINSYKGSFGSAHGRTYTPYIKGARWEPTSGISRLAWGMGAFNDRILGTVSLACARGYELPAIIGTIAADLPEEMWNRERHAGELEEWCDRAVGAWEVNKVTYKTPDYMLCSAQDYHPGHAGYQQHIWQATFGPDAVIFVTHPPCVSEEGSHRPNFWHGNVILPRVAQWKDVLIAIYRLPENDWMGFTHAYFPQWAFDEHLFKGDWAFARKGDGYIALTAAQGLQRITQGDSAYREVRSVGKDNVWLCQMGRAALDGPFNEFVRKVLALDLAFDHLSARYTSLRGDAIAFGWEGPLLLNGREQPITGFRHYESPYCVVDLPATQMEIQYLDQGMRLDFSLP